MVVCGGTPQSTDTPVPVPNSIEADYFIAADDEVIQDFDGAIRLDSQYADAHYNRGIAYQHLGMTKKAENDFEKTKELGDRK